jgi:ABC-type transport system involved in multi-copper enzyme maturation permease subunit
MTVMLGPIFNAEMLRAGRRGRAHVLRWIYGGWLCLQLVYCYGLTHPEHPVPTTRASVSSGQRDSNFGRAFRDLVMSQQFALLILLTPAFVAGAITDEKTRGTLGGLLTAYVTAADVVVGKLAARCTQVAILSLTPLPLLALVGQYAGITPEFLLCLVAVTVLVLFGLGGVSMLASVGTRQTRTAVLATYVGLFGGAWLLNAVVAWCRLPSEWWSWFDPIRPLWPALDRVNTAEAFRRVGQLALTWGVLGFVTTGVAVWQLRPAYLRQLGTRPRRRAIGRMCERPRPKGDVVAWKECYVGRRVPQWLGVPFVFAVAAGATGYTLSQWRNTSWQFAVPVALTHVGLYILLLLTLLVGIRSSGTITGERDRQTWDGLMTTPLTGSQIVRGKLRGIMWSAWPYLFAAWLGAMAMAGIVSTVDWETSALCVLLGLSVAGLLVAFSRRWAARVTLGLAVAWVAATIGGWTLAAAGICILVTWLAMYFLGAVGMYCSARFGSSWRSLLATVVYGYVGGTVVGCVGMPLGCIGTLMLSVFFDLVERTLGAVAGPPAVGAIGLRAGGWSNSLWTPVMALGSACLLWVTARLFLSSAETQVGHRDRFLPPEWALPIPVAQWSRSRRVRH